MQDESPDAMMTYKEQPMTTAALNFSSIRPLDPMADEQNMIRLSQAGDQEMFARLYDTYVERIYRYIYFRVADAEMAEDITSLVFLKVWEKIGTYQAGESPFMAWLYRIAHNAVIDHYRTRKVSISLDEANPIELSHADQIDEKLDLQVKSQQLREALQELTEEQQQVLVLKFVNGLSTLEIAQQLGKRQGAVRALQMRGLQTLAQYPGLQEEYGDAAYA
jgi:RNA polymerase sigma-70 factor, ECF subfamily